MNSLGLKAKTYQQPDTADEGWDCRDGQQPPPAQGRNHHHRQGDLKYRSQRPKDLAIK